MILAFIGRVKNALSVDTSFIWFWQVELSQTQVLVQPSYKHSDVVGFLQVFARGSLGHRLVASSSLLDLLGPDRVQGGTGGTGPAPSSPPGPLAEL